MNFEKKYKNQSSTNDSEEDIFYGRKFTQVERTTFYQLTREALAREEGEPKCPEALAKVRVLMCENPKKDFYPRGKKKKKMVSKIVVFFSSSGKKK